MNSGIIIITAIISMNIMNLRRNRETEKIIKTEIQVDKVNIFDNKT